MSEDLNIIVCVKQVPETTDVEFDLNTGTLIREGVDSIVNPFDEYAVEEALRLKERYGGSIKVISMGPPQAETALRDTIALGCDEAWLATDQYFAGADTWATSFTLSLCIEKLAPYDIILCGLKTTDGDTGQVAPELAHQLGLPHICYVNNIIDIADSKIKLTRILDEGVETLETSLPLVISVSKDINQPRLATLRGKLNARKAQIKKITSNEINVEREKLGLDGSYTKVVKILIPEPPTGGEVVTGKPEELADKIFKKLIECKVI
jgi:electron transfer flavoprotein beta subunit